MPDSAGQVIDLRAPRGARPDVRALARDRLMAARRLAGMTREAWAEELTRILGWPVTPDLVSAWETTAAAQAEVLVAAEHVLTSRTPGAAVPPPVVERFALVQTWTDLQDAMARVIDEAEQVLAVTGSRSRDPDYLARIESAVAVRDLEHYRVLYGPPRHQATRNHLQRLVDLARPDRVHLGLCPDLHRDGERFILASERTAVIVLPSLTSLLNFDTALVTDDGSLASAWVSHVRQAWAASEQLTTRTAVEALEVLR